MKEFLLKALDYTVDAGLATLQQLFVLFAPILLLALAMHLVSRQTVKLSYEVLGEKIYLYVFGWLGTAVHELGHAMFAVIFTHKIDKIKFFTPNSGKSLGHVKHRYNARNPYQTTGNFFIGIGPVLLGALLLFAVTLLLFDLNVFRVAEKNGAVIHISILKDWEEFKNTMIGISVGLWESLVFIFTGPNTNWWKLLLFVYLFYSVGTAIILSPSDIQGAFRGFVYFVILLFVVNLATLWMGGFLLENLDRFSYYFSGFYFVILLSIGLNLIFIMVLYFLKVALSLFEK